MVRSELIQKLFEQHPELPLETAEAVVDVMFKTMLAALECGNRVELRGFGSFVTRARTARMASNPRTGEAVCVEEKRVPFFRAGKPLLNRLNLESEH